MYVPPHVIYVLVHFVVCKMQATYLFNLLYIIFVWLGGRMVRMLDLRSIGREFESRPLRYRMQLWASC